MNKETQALHAFNLWNDNIISTEVFYETLNKIKGINNPNSLNSPNSPNVINNPLSITQGQINYIKLLQKEGKIPASQGLNISKIEAQALIHNALERKELPSTNENEEVSNELEENHQAEWSKSREPYKAPEKPKEEGEDYSQYVM